MLRLGSADALNSALRRIADPAAPARDRIALLDALAQTAKPEAVPVLLKLLADPKESVRAAALAALQPFPNPAVAEAVLAAYPKLSSALRGKAQAFLAGRPASSQACIPPATFTASKPLPISQAVTCAERPPIAHTT